MLTEYAVLLQNCAVMGSTVALAVAVTAGQTVLEPQNAPTDRASESEPEDSSETHAVPIGMFADTWFTTALRNSEQTVGLSQTLYVGYALTPKLILAAYSGWSYIHVVGGDRAFGASNPALELTYKVALPKNFGLWVGGAAAPPVGAPSGDSPEPGAQLAVDMGRFLSGNEFSPNYVGLQPFLGVGYGQSTGPTCWLRVNPYFMLRARGEEFSPQFFEAWFQSGGSFGYWIGRHVQPFLAFYYFTSMTTQDYIRSSPETRDYLYGWVGTAFRLPVHERLSMRVTVAVIQALNQPRRRQEWFFWKTGVGFDF